MGGLFGNKRPKKRSPKVWKDLKRTKRKKKKTPKSTGRCISAASRRQSKEGRGIMFQLVLKELFGRGDAAPSISKKTSTLLSDSLSLHLTSLLRLLFILEGLEEYRQKRFESVEMKLHTWQTFKRAHLNNGK